MNISEIVEKVAVVFYNRHREAPLRKTAILSSAKYFAEVPTLLQQPQTRIPQRAKE